MQLSQGIAGLLAVGLAISLVTNTRRGDRIAALEASLEEAEEAAAKPGRETTRTVYADDLGDLDGSSDDPNDKPPLDDIADMAASLAADDPSLILSLPEVEAAMEEHINTQLGERRKAWQRRHLDANRERFTAYAEEAEMDEEITEEIDSLMEGTMLDIATLRQERHAGDVPDEEAFEELGGLRTDFREDLVDIVGEEEADRLQERLIGPLSRTYYDNDNNNGNTPSEEP
ncbi:MAG: hypothetical protein ACI8RZ_003526 [Myxococcota bacterium]|jgi:hypothetical protein